MGTRRPVPWLVTERGRNFTMGVISATGVGLVALNYGPNTFFIDKYMDFTHSYKNGTKVELSSKVSDVYKKCLDILQLTDGQKKLLKPFNVFGLDLFHAGSLSSRFGAAIGIPENFQYETEKDIDKEGLLVNLKNVDWDSEAGKKLAYSLVLPENVQKFAISREILMTQNNKIILDAAYPVIAIGTVYSMAQRINSKYSLYAYPRGLRLTLYTILGLFGTGLYYLLKDYTQVLYETKVDKKLSELSPEFIDSGIVFYDKILKRNQALRELLGSEGEEKYSILGNENYFLRQPRMPLLHRKMFFEKIKNGENLDGEQQN